MKIKSLIVPKVEVISYDRTYLLVINRYGYRGNSTTIAETIYFFELKK